MTTTDLLATLRYGDIKVLAQAIDEVQTQQAFLPSDAHLHQGLLAEQLRVLEARYVELCNRDEETR